MISPGQVDRLQDELDKYTSAIIVGCLFFFVGATLGIFASQEFATGTDFMQRLSGGEQSVGALLILVGWIKVRSIKAALGRHVPPQLATQTTAAGAGHRATKDRQADEVHQLSVGANYT